MFFARKKISSLVLPHYAHPPTPNAWLLPRMVKNSVPSPTSPRSSTSTTRSGSNAGGSQYSLPGFGASANSSGAAKSNSNSSGATVSASATGTALNQMLPVHAPSSAAALPSSSSPPPTSASSPPFFMTGAAVDVTTPTPLSESTAPLPSHQRAAVPTRGAMTADEGKKRALTDRTVREGQCVSVPGVGIGGGQQQHDAGWSCAGSARDRGGVSPGMSQVRPRSWFDLRLLFDEGR